MFSEKLKRGIAGLLVVCMTISSNGFATLASSVSEFASDVKQEGSAEAKNYYFEYAEEREEITIVKTAKKNAGEEEVDESLGETLDEESSAEQNENASAVDDTSEADSQEAIEENPSEEIVEGEKPDSDDEEIVAPDASHEEEEETGYEEEPEDEEESSTEDAPSEDVEVSENETDENIDDTTDETVETEESETETVEATEETTTVEETEETTVESEAAKSTEESTEETTTLEETEESTEETTTVEKETEETTQEEETEGIESIDEEATDSEATIEEEIEELLEIATESEIEEEEVVEDIIATESEMEFVDEEATGSNVRIVRKYITVKASPSIVKDGPSNWYIKKFLYNDQVGSTDDYFENDFDADKYLKKEIKVLIADQYGDEKVITIPVTWDKEKIDYNFGQKPTKKQEFIKVTKEEAMTLDTDKTFEEQVEGKTFEDEIKENIEEIKKQEEKADEKVVDDDDEEEENKKSDVTYEEEKEEDDEIVGMNGTLEEEPEEDAPYTEITKIEEKDAEVVEDGNDMEVEEGGTVVYENVYVDEEGNELSEEEVEEASATSEEDKTADNVVEGNANNNMFTKEELPNQTNITPNMLGVMRSLASMLGQDDTLSFDPSDVEMPIITLGDVLTGHDSHPICGGTLVSGTHNCSGDHFDGHPSGGAVHSNQLYKTTVASTGETTSGYVDFEWQGVTTARALVAKPRAVDVISKYAAALEATESALLAVDYHMEQNYKVLAQDITIDDAYVMDYGSLHICLNGHTLTFEDDGAIIVIGGMANEITICNCQSAGRSGLNTATREITGGGIVGAESNVFNRMTINQAKGYDSNYNPKDNISLEGKHPLGYISMLGDGNISLYGMSPTSYNPETAKGAPVDANDRSLVFYGMNDNIAAGATLGTDMQSFVYCDGTSDTRKVYMSDVTAKNMHGIFAGFGNFKNVDSFVLNRGYFEDLTALNGAIANVEYDGSTNKFAEVMHTTITGCKTRVASANFNKQTYNYLHEFYVADTRKGMIAISGYSSVEAQDGEWRLITNNDIEGNTNVLDSSVITWNTVQGSNAVYVGYNKLEGNTLTTNINEAGWSPYNTSGVSDAWNARKEVFAPVMRFTSSNKEGVVNIYKNEINENKTVRSGSSDYFAGYIKTAGSMAFSNLMNVNYNVYSYNEKGAAYITHEEGHKNEGGYSGALVVQDVTSLQVRNTEFKNCKAEKYVTNSAYGRGGAIYANNVQEITLGYNIDQKMAGQPDPIDDSMMLFTGCEADYGGAIYVENNDLYTYDTVHKKYDKRNKLQVLNAIFKGNTANKDGGAVYYLNTKAHASVKSHYEAETAGEMSAAIAHGQDFINMSGTILEDNTAGQNGGAIFVDSAKLEFEVLRERKGNEIVHNFIDHSLSPDASEPKKGGAIYAWGARINVDYANTTTNYPLIMKQNGFLEDDTTSADYKNLGVIYVKSEELAQLPEQRPAYTDQDSFSDGGTYTFDCSFGSTIFDGGDIYERTGSVGNYTYTAKANPTTNLDGGVIFFEQEVSYAAMYVFTFSNININKGTSIFRNRNAFFIAGGALNFEHLTQGVNTNLMGKELILVGDDNLAAPPEDARMMYADVKLPERGANIGQYIIGTDPTKDIDTNKDTDGYNIGSASHRTIINLYGGEIMGNILDAPKSYGPYADGYRDGTSTTRYMYEGIFGQKKVDGTELTSAFNDQNDGRIVEVFLAGNIAVKQNKRKNAAGTGFEPYEHNLPLQEYQEILAGNEENYKKDEKKRRYAYRIRDKIGVLGTAPSGAAYPTIDLKLHKNAAIGFTPMETYKDDQGHTCEVQMFGMGAGASLFNSTYIEGMGQGAEIGSMIFNSRKEDDNDKRIIYVSVPKILLANPEQLLNIKFDFDDMVAGVHTRVIGDELPDQYISQGMAVAKVVQPNAVSDEDGTFKYTLPTDPNYARIFDVMGDVKYWQAQYIKSENPGMSDEQAWNLATGSEFDIWDWDLPLKYGDPPADGRSRLYVIYALMNHSHRICGSSNNESCVHLNTEQDCAKYITNTGEWKPENIVIQVNNVAQLMYAKRRPEYMYVLTNDIIIGDNMYDRSTAGLLGDINTPINGLKLCLNGHKLIASESRVALALTGNCYICDCGGRKSDDTGFNNTHAGAITYKDGIVPTSELIKVVPNDVNNTAELHIMGCEMVSGSDADAGKIKVEGIPGGITTGFVQIATYDDAQFVAEKVAFKGNGTSANPLKGSLIDLSCNAYFADVAFRNNWQNNTGMPGVGERTFVNGQGLVKLTDIPAHAKEDSFKNIEFTDNHILGEYSSLIYTKYEENSSQLSITADGASVDPAIPEVRSKFEDNELSNLAAITMVDNNREYDVNDNSSIINMNNTTFIHNYIKHAETSGVAY